MSKPIVGNIIDNINLLSILQEAIQFLVRICLQGELLIASAFKMPYRAIRLWENFMKA